MTCRRQAVWLATATGVLLATTSVGAQRTYDLVIVNGRVIDPESGLDAVRSLGIRGGRIAAITAGALRGQDTVDAATWSWRRALSICTSTGKHRRAMTSWRSTV
jgi:hypothetical protein